MAEALFFRLLDIAIEEKGGALAQTIASMEYQEGGAENTAFQTDPQSFGQIPRAPFAYWASNSLRQLFANLRSMGDEYEVKQGLATANDFRFVRTWWEVAAWNIAFSVDNTEAGQRWVHFAKGGAYSPFYADVHMVVDWEQDGRRIRNFYKPSGRLASRPQNTAFYFRPGLTWPLRTQKGLNFRAMPKDCIFGHKGPVVIEENDDIESLVALLGTANSLPFKMLVELQMAFGSYEVGVIKRTPVPLDLSLVDTTLVRIAHNLARESALINEVTHAFKLPGLIYHRKLSLMDASLKLETEAQDRLQRLADMQQQLDEISYELYGLNESDRRQVQVHVTHPILEELETTEDVDDEAEGAPPEDLPDRVQNLLMWCVGVAFGRWDVRFALDPGLLPDLQGPFDPLPRCAPGALVGIDGLPANQANIASEAWLSARENVLHLPEMQLTNGAPATISPEQYPLSIAWDGILVDDPSHPADLVNRVRQMLVLVWGERAGDIEKEGCEILGYKGLRDYFRDPRKGFFAFHIKRYSKSRRKAPIYWLLQSENRNYAIWLYCHRLDDTTYFTAARDYADTKVNLETARLDELRQGLAALSGSAQKRREREIERQQKLVSEVTTFRNKLDEIALRQLPPDHNDGVIISIAPLWELVPWKDAKKMYQELVAGKYEWSTMAQQMKARGLVKT